MDSRITFRLNEDEKAAAAQYAQRKGIHNLSAVARVALVQFLREEGYIKDPAPKKSRAK